MEHAKSLMAGEVPEDWMEHWEGTEKVQPFMRLAVGKTAALRSTWLDRMASKSLLKVIRLSAASTQPTHSVVFRIRSIWHSFSDHRIS